MTVKRRIVAYLASHPQGADDDELTSALGLTRRQQANQACNLLATMNLIIRQLGPSGKLRNYPLSAASALAATTVTPGLAHQNTPWYWEGNVQQAAANYLVSNGYSILRVANTRTHQTGRDIEAAKAGVTLWVTVKGYPNGTPRTRPQTQARHWFKHAIFDVVVWRGAGPSTCVAVALPDFHTYRALAKKTAWFQGLAQFSFLWVSPDDNRVKVTSEPPLPA